MSYDFYLVDPVTRETLTVEFNHQVSGGTYCLGGTNELRLNITSNYYRHYRRVFKNEDGIKILIGKSGAESIPILEEAISLLGDQVDSDYWEPTEGNAKKALYGLLALAQIRPDGIWDCWY